MLEQGKGEAIDRFKEEIEQAVDVGYWAYLMESSMSSAFDNLMKIAGYERARAETLKIIEKRR